MSALRFPGTMLIAVALVGCSRPHPPEGAAGGTLPGAASSPAPTASAAPALGPARFLLAGHRLIDLAGVVAVPIPATDGLGAACVEGDTAFYLSMGNTLSAEDATTHHPRFSAQLSEHADALLAVGDTVFAVGSRVVLGLDRATGHQRFRREIGHHLALRADRAPTQLDGPVAAGRSLAVADDEGNVHLVGPDGVVVDIAPPPPLPPDPEAPPGHPWVTALVSTEDGVCIITVELPGSVGENRQHVRCVAADGTSRWELPWRRSISSATQQVMQISAHHLLLTSHETDSRHDISRRGTVYRLTDGSRVLETHERIGAFVETPDGKLVGAFAPDDMPSLVDEKRAGRFLATGAPDAAEPAFRIPDIGGGDGVIAAGLDGDCVFAFWHRAAGVITLIRADVATGKERWRKQIELADGLAKHEAIAATLHRWGDHLAIRYLMERGTGAIVINSTTGEVLLKVP